MTPEELKQIQKIDTELLFNVADICEKHGIEYFLLCGTLLGAVRHGGPIPWDDDVDIGMTRENYMRFLEVAPQELDNENEITIMGSGSAKYLSEMKIGRKNTRRYLPGTENLKIMHRIQLDIFLVDYIKKLNPSKKNIYEKIRFVLNYAKLNWDEKRLIFRCIKESSRRFKFIYIAGFACMHLIRIILGEQRIEHIIYNMFVDTEKKSGQLGIVTGNEPVYLWSEKHFKDYDEINYAGRLLSVPADYHKLLTDLYGDYMQFPPEDKRYRSNFSKYIVEINDNAN